MKVVSLIDLVNDEKNFIKDSFINIDSSNFKKINEYLKKHKDIHFENCVFNGDFLIHGFSNKLLQLKFTKCSFCGNLEINDCQIKNLIFDGLETANNIFIKNVKLNDFILKNIENPLKLNIHISNSVFYNRFICSKVKIKSGEFTINLIKSYTGEENKLITEFYSSELKYVSFINSDFGFKTSFSGLKINSLAMSNCNFNALHVYNNFIDDFELQYCTFKEYTTFGNNKKLKFGISYCTFLEFSNFDNSLFDKFLVEFTFFKGKASFENLSTNNFRLNQVSFSDSAYFDDLNKNNEIVIENWDRKTIRSIKRELLNNHNQIDYLRFKAYELEAYKKEKGKSWKDNVILKLNSCSSKNGLDWFRGLLFTIFGSIFIFYLYTIFEVYHFFSNPLDYSFISSDRVNEYFFFLNPTEFDYHFEKLKSNRTNLEATITFIFAKIFIAYGVYQTIQAFRKFGKNGD